MAESIGSVYLGIIPQLKGNPTSDGHEYGKKFGSGAKASIGAGAVALGNILSTGLMSAAGALGDQFVDAFNASADFEQLYGGVEKIFDQADISGIMEDAQNAYKTLNMSANEYLESINQTGAAFAATMGDQAGYDTAKQGMQAIADYASGTGRNLDELNEKYALITRATSSYQSIADQFSGILPATSADFLAQAQAAGFLSTEYQKLTDVPIAEYQQAVSAMLEKGVDDMGLLGNTTAESTETVSGSLAMLKSSWDNFLTSLGSDEMPVEETVNQLVDSLVAAAQNIIPRLGEIGASLAEALPQLAEQLSPYVDQLMAQVGAFIQEHQPEIEAAAQTAFDGVKQGISIALQAAIQGIGEFLGNAIATFPEWFPQFLAAGGELLLSIVQGLVLGIQPFMNQLEETMNDGIKVVTDAVSDFFNGGAEIINGIVEGIGSGIGEVATKAGEVRDSIAEALGSAKDKVVQIATDIKNGFTNGISSIASKARSTFDRVKQAISDPINKAKDTVKGAVDKIKGFFPFNIGKILNLKIPHISVSGGSPPFGIGGAGSLPSFSVSWYAKGGFAKGAQLIGVGEQGTELIWPEYSPYFDKYANAIAERIGGGGITINLNYAAGDDANDMLRDISSGIRQLRAAGAI